MRKLFLSIFLCLFFEIVFSVAFAGSSYIAIDGGLSYIKVGKTQQVDVNGVPVKTDTYRDRSTTKHSMTGAPHFGYIFPTSLRTLLALGYRYIYNGKAKSGQYQNLGAPGKNWKQEKYSPTI